MSTIVVTMYIKPNGRAKETSISNVYDEDADFINQHHTKIGMEECGAMGYVVYFDYGEVNGDEPVEWIEFSQGRDCEETIKAGLENVRILWL